MRHRLGHEMMMEMMRHQLSHRMALDIDRTQAAMGAPGRGSPRSLGQASGLNPVGEAAPASHGQPFLGPSVALPPSVPPSLQRSPWQRGLSCSSTLPLRRRLLRLAAAAAAAAGGPPAGATAAGAAGMGGALGPASCDVLPALCALDAGLWVSLLQPSDAVLPLVCAAAS